jgi:nicotinate-nucleotide adenylyltransferase
MVPMDRRKRIALYGGTFDPIHLGHLEIARKISTLFEIDQLWLVPAQVAPHKFARAVTPALHRHAMLVLATQNDPGLLISTFELDGPGRCYTVDTLAHFSTQWGPAADLFFIMGADSWLEINTWRDCDRLLAMVNHIVVSRPGYQLSLDHLAPQLAQRVRDVRGVDRGRLSEILSGEAGPHIFITDAVMVDVSATDIRRAAREQGPELMSMVPPGVADYIRKYELYRDANGRQFNHQGKITASQ